MKYKSEKLIGGLADGKKDSEFDKDDLEDATKHESEHTNNKKMAKEIAKDHLTEDAKYYVKLKKIEKSKRANVGEIRNRKDGAWKKESMGEWVHVDSVEPRHEARDRSHLDAILSSMKSRGWDGPPLVGYSLGEGRVQLITGSHRYHAAVSELKKVPVRIIDIDESFPFNSHDVFDELESADDDEALAKWAEKYKDGLDSDVVELLKLESEKIEKSDRKSSHKYIHKYKKDGKWIYIYQSGESKRRLQDEEVKALFDLASIGHETSKKLIDGAQEHSPEKMKLLKELADLGHVSAQKHLQEHIDRLPPFFLQHVVKDSESEAAAIEAASEAKMVKIFNKESEVPASLNGVAFSPWDDVPKDMYGWQMVEGQNNNILEPEFVKPDHLHASS
jgi:hypothetical protein